MNPHFSYLGGGEGEGGWGGGTIFTSTNEYTQLAASGHYMIN